MANQRTIITYVCTLLIGSSVGAGIDVWAAHEYRTGRAREVQLAGTDVLPYTAPHTGVLRLAVLNTQTNAAAAVDAVAGPGSLEDTAPASQVDDDAVRVSIAAARTVASALAGRDVSRADVIVEADMSGPSAGLAYTLAIADAATPGRLVDPAHPIAATGQIGAEGDVMAVGGYDAKFAAARRAGAELILAPPGVPGDVAAQHADLYVPVGSISEAVAALCRRGSDDAMCVEAE